MTNATPTMSNTSSRNTIIVAASWVAVAAMAGVIFWMSANTGESVNTGLGIISAAKAALASIATAVTGNPNVDVSPIGHFAEYFVFGILLANALRFHTKGAWIVVVAVLIGSLYGISDEFHQYFVPERSCDPADWLVDTIAALCGAALFAVIHGRFKKS